MGRLQYTLISKVKEALTAIEYKTPETDIENDNMIKDLLDILQPENPIIINTDHCKTPEEKEFEIYAALVRHAGQRTMPQESPGPWPGMMSEMVVGFLVADEKERLLPTRSGDENKKNIKYK